MGYDGSGRLTSRRDPRGNVPIPPAGYLSEWTYDDCRPGRRSSTDARGNVTDYDYYDNELLWKTTSPTEDGTPRVTTLRVRRREPALEDDRPARRCRDAPLLADGQLKSVESAEGRKTSTSTTAPGS